MHACISSHEMIQIMACWVDCRKNHWNTMTPKYCPNCNRVRKPPMDNNPTA